tara:strand:- start:336 stop:575 length:240 start_codon:yes stop_codon:yes gene_type:complete
MSTDVKVEMVKLGDVLHHLDRMISLNEKFRDDNNRDCIKYKGNNDNLYNWYDGRSCAYDSAVQDFKEVRLFLQALKINK